MNEEDLTDEEREVRDLLATAPAESMPDDVFAQITHALSVEVQLRREDPDRDGTRRPRATAPGRGSTGWAAGPTDAAGRSDLEALGIINDSRRPRQGGQGSWVDDLDDCGTLD